MKWSLPASKKIHGGILASIGLILAVMLGFQMAQPDHAENPESNRYAAGNSHTSDAVPAASVTKKATTGAAAERPFWEDAVVLEPTGGPGPATETVFPQPTAADAPRDYKAEVLSLEHGGEARRLNDSLLLWFTQDATAATVWINDTERFDDIKPSLGSLALNIAGQGQIETALVWADSIQDEASRHDTRMRIYAREARQKRINAGDLGRLGFNQEDIATILSGALGD